ncbi:unnamed protein product [Gulo gulo]|uniref:60S ribosomal protein L21 n=1 Tax=Gulo gulo TaxID=48420 RepID=A0A9X9MA15_GULGU|nr:unnamed protein product [Gulo gulo]
MTGFWPELPSSRSSPKRPIQRERGEVPAACSRDLLETRSGSFGRIRANRQGDTVDGEGMGTVQKGTPHKWRHDKTGRVHSVAQHVAGIAVNKQGKGKILATRMKVRLEHSNHSKSQATFLKR